MTPRGIRKKTDIHKMNPKIMVLSNYNIILLSSDLPRSFNVGILYHYLFFNVTSGAQRRDCDSLTLVCIQPVHSDFYRTALHTLSPCLIALN